jgi:hypothetical protein
MEASLMEKFLFIPPVDESAPPLKARQWTLLVVSFAASLALFALFMLTVSSHILFALLIAFIFPAISMPMQMYAMNRKGRWIGRLFLVCIAIAVVVGIYNNRAAVYKLGNEHFLELLIIVLIAASVYWITYCIDQVGNVLLKRLDILQRRVNSVESKVDHLERTIRKAKPETEKIPAD